MSVVHEYAVLALRRTDPSAWTAWLAERLVPHWRPGEWDAESLLFTADPDNTRNRAVSCRVGACGALVECPASRCAACRAVSARRGHPGGLRRNSRALPAMRQPNVGDGVCLGRGQFSLSDLSEAVRADVLYALQQRDDEDRSVQPATMRRIIRDLPPGLPSLLELDAAFPITHLPRTTHSLFNDLPVRLRRVRVQHDGIDPTLEDVWDCALVGLLSAPNRRDPAASGDVGFRPIRQRWLREIVKECGCTVRPTVAELRRTLNVTVLASNALLSRLAGESPHQLGLAEMTCIVEAIQSALNPKDGSVYSLIQRRATLRWWRRIMQYARLTGLMDDVPGGFALSPELHGIEVVDTAEDEGGRTIPEHVIAQLDQHLHLMGADSSHKEQGSLIRRYIIWRNKHAADERLRKVVSRANVA